jgi:GST-like protein
MYDVFVARSPAPWKVLIALEEIGADFVEHHINPGAGEQLTPEFKKLNPNSKIPVLVDNAPLDRDEPYVVFESGAILLYLAEKHGQLMPDDMRHRYEAIQWIMWQMSGLGPIFGNARHFRHFAPETVPYGITRFSRECSRLCSVLDTHLSDREYIAGTAYSMADICVFPWLLYAQSNGVDEGAYPNLDRWFRTIDARPAVQRLGTRTWKTYDYAAATPVNDAARQILFGRTR